MQKIHVQKNAGFGSCIGQNPLHEVTPKRIVEKDDRRMTRELKFARILADNRGPDPKSCEITARCATEFGGEIDAGQISKSSFMGEDQRPAFPTPHVDEGPAWNILDCFPKVRLVYGLVPEKILTMEQSLPKQAGDAGGLNSKPPVESIGMWKKLALQSLKHAGINSPFAERDTKIN